MKKKGKNKNKGAGEEIPKNAIDSTMGKGSVGSITGGRNDNMLDLQKGGRKAICLSSSQGRGKTKESKKKNRAKWVRVGLERSLTKYSIQNRSFGGD